MEEEDKMKLKIMAYDRAIEMLKEFVDGTTKDINSIIQDTEGTANIEPDISALEILEEQIKDLQRLRNNYDTALCMFKLQNIQLDKEKK